MNPTRPDDDTDEFPAAPFADDWHLIDLRTGQRATAVTAHVATGAQFPPPGEEIMYAGTGWVQDPDAVERVLEEWARAAIPVRFQDAAPHLMFEANDDYPVFFWDAESIVLGKRLAAWNQKRVGACVGFGFGRGSQDLLLWEIAAGGESEEWPGAEISPEVTYAGSRVEVGGGRIRGDGSIGAWAAKFVGGWGVVKRGVYGRIDLTTYSESLCRSLGYSGLPADLEAVAKQHPVRAAALVASAAEGWSALGAGKPIAVCSDVGFTTQLDRDGFCFPSGNWNHCMAWRGRFRHPRRGRSVVIGNSWDNYMGTPPEGVPVEYIDREGRTAVFQLPPGHFCTTLDVFGRMLAQRDSFALAGLSGWEVQRVSYIP